MLGFLRRQDKEKTDRAIEKTKNAWFGRVRSLLSGAKIDEELWDQLEEALISADVGVEATMQLLDRLRDRVRDEGLSEADGVVDLLKQEIVDILSVDGDDGSVDSDETPLVILVAGVNGAGKTTSIAKLANLYKQDGRQVLLGAADTFRAAAIEQLQAWGERLGVDVIAHSQGADPGAVAFDTVQAAKARGVDVTIIDTAGRLQTKTNLMEELKKIQRVVERNGVENYRVLLALDATTGQNGLAQARAFTEAVKCDGVFLAKLDGTAKGGIVIAIAGQLKMPVVYVGTGEQPDDIASFNPEEFVDALFGTEEER